MISIVFDAEAGVQLARDFESSYGKAEWVTKGDWVWLNWTTLPETAVVAAMMLMRADYKIREIRMRNPNLTEEGIPVDDCGA